MNKNDRFLIAIVAGTGILLVAAFLFALQRPDPGYRLDDSPENIVHNYLLAIENRDYARAYTYLSPDLGGYPPDLETFIQDTERNSWNFRRDVDHSLSIQSSRVVGAETIVSVRLIEYYNNFPFGSQSNTNTFAMRLKPGGAGWVIVSGEQFFWECWNKLEPYCRY